MYINLTFNEKNFKSFINQMHFVDHNSKDFCDTSNWEALKFDKRSYLINLNFFFCSACSLTLGEATQEITTR